LARNLQLTSKVTIASSGTVSSSLTLEGGRTVFALRTPTALTGTTFTFQASDDANNFYDLYNGSTQYSVTVAASRFIALNTEVMAGVRYLKVVSNSAEAASRDIIVINGEL
jgi:hypothetical protein